eukprot:CAMPEP_0197452356 /NCGR_PEP_ID=MMETSP1175-20131217/31855_1 /TAXON_ID=1003142 /ORGANISM="Triceratium dubium, Strain CCMP147" /LENGTH=131 /DNA_ID=CAMNT_0042985341 /DNA_START=140 /DNA_END=535 /DNA_ORIENTATION=-
MTNKMMPHELRSFAAQPQSGDGDDDGYVTLMLSELRSRVEREQRCDHSSFTRRRRHGLETLPFNVVGVEHEAIHHCPIERNPHTSSFEGSSSNLTYTTLQPAKKSSFQKRPRGRMLKATSDSKRDLAATAA